MGIATWWSDTYGECPRMFYHAFAGMPEFAPPQQDHILYSYGILKDVIYGTGAVGYTAHDAVGTEYLRLSYLPTEVTLNGSPLPLRTDLTADGWMVRDLGGGDYAVTVHHTSSGAVRLATDTGSLPEVTINGAQTYQVIDGFGVNANHRSWNGTELQPVLDALIDQAGMTLFRVVFDNTDWEATNDNSDPALLNWTYYNTIYGASRFTPLWDLVAYLNGRGITDGVFFNFMGPGPAWLGGATLTAGKEAEWAEMITSLLAYARNTKGLQFRSSRPTTSRTSPTKASPWGRRNTRTALNVLAQSLDANGLGDVRFVAPDLAGGGTGYFPELLADPVVMAKLPHFGVHSYSDGGGGSGGVLSYLQGSAYPDRNFWMTEFNVWCSTCDSGVRGNYDWNYTRGTADYLLDHLANGASAGIVWEGYDSFYAHPPSTWSFWGLLAVDNENVTPKTYTPRKNFYTVAQISKFVRPGARRIGVGGTTAPFAPLLAFYHAGLGQVTMVGINTSGSAATLRGTLASLPTVACSTSPTRRARPTSPPAAVSLSAMARSSPPSRRTVCSP